MAAVMIGIDPHKGSHTAVAISAAEEPLGQLRVRACAAQAERLLEWAQAWPQRTWAVEGAGGIGHLLAQQLLSAGERVLDVQPKLGVRVGLLAAGDVNRNDPNDARSVAVAALRSAGVREAGPDDHAAVLKIWSKRHRDLASARTQVACRLHAVLRAGPRRGPRAHHRRPGRADRGSGHAAGCGFGSPLRTCRSLHRGSAPHRRAAARDQEEARYGRPGVRHQPDRAVRGRPGDRRDGHRRRPSRLPLRQPGPLRRLERHRAGRGVLRPAEGAPAQPARQPAGRPRHPHGRGYPGQPPAQPGAAPATTRNWPRARPPKKRSAR